MRFRPCIDIHNGRVKQLVGGSLKDEGDQAAENYVSEQDAAFYADLYKRSGLTGGHIILLNPEGSRYYDADVRQAQSALETYPGGFMLGGGIRADNASRFLDMGASHVIATSYVFQNGEIRFDRLQALKQAVGKEHLVLDLSCRSRDGNYYIVTDRWQKYTNVTVCKETLEMLSEYCDEYLVHAVDVEGKASGIERQVVGILASWNGLPVTYAGGISSFHDLDLLKEAGNGRLDVTIGSALDIFGGSMKYHDVIKYMEG